jgi:uncharacterized protein (TIGR00725 family)
MKRYVAVIGPGNCRSESELIAARTIGRLLAEQGIVVITGGLGGIMAAASEGAEQVGGLSVGLLPGRDRSAGNEHLSVAIPTGLGELRNGLVIQSCDAVIAVGCSWGTLSELSLAMRMGIPVVSLGSCEVTDSDGISMHVDRAQTAEQAVEKVMGYLNLMADSAQDFEPDGR